MLLPFDRHHPQTVQHAAAPRPHWDAQYRELRVGSCVIKVFRVPSPNQEAILAAFQEEGWPRRIFDPLPPEGEVVSKCRLRDTIKSLNRLHKHQIIRFGGDGTGEGVFWEYVEAAVLALPVDAEPNKLRFAA